MVRFLKFTSKKEIYEKFEEFLSKLVWRETLFIAQYDVFNRRWIISTLLAPEFGSVSNLLYRLVINLDLTFIKVLKKI